MAWTCSACQHINRVQDSFCERCPAEHYAPAPPQPLVLVPARLLPLRDFTEAELAMIRTEFAAIRQILGLPPRADATPGHAITCDHMPAQAGTPVQVLARRTSPRKPSVAVVPEVPAAEQEAAS